MIEESSVESSASSFISFRLPDHYNIFQGEVGAFKVAADALLRSAAPLREVKKVLTSLSVPSNKFAIWMFWVKDHSGMVGN